MLLKLITHSAEAERYTAGFSFLKMYQCQRRNLILALASFFGECRKINVLYTSKRFYDVAEIAIQNMQSEMIHGGGRVIYKDYTGALRKKHIPYFDRTYITSIDQDKILAFEGWRIETADRVPAKSTILTHNAALQMVFKEAIDKKWMLPVEVTLH